MADPNFVSDNEWESRGLEVRARVRSKARKETRKAVSHAVLVEQEEQRITNVIDPERIGLVCEEISCLSAMRGYKMGMDDRLAVEEYLWN